MKTITVSIVVKKNIGEAWDFWTDPNHIKNWYHASDDWGVGDVQNDLRVGGRFKTNMHAKDGSAGFDFNGTYTKIHEKMSMSYTIEGGRKVDVIFESHGNSTKVTEVFEMEATNTEEQQRSGWQSILENFKKYAESH